MSTRLSGGEVAGLGALTLVALALRLLGADRGLWMDEASAAFLVFRKPFETLLTIYPGDIHHPLYSVLAHASVGLFGEQVWSMRLPAIVAGTLGVPVLFALADFATTRREAWCAAALVTFSYPHVWFAQNARGYTLLALAAALTTLLLLRAFSSGRAATLIAYALVAGLGAFTHITMVFIVVGHAGVWGVEVAGRLLRRRPVSTALWRCAIAFPLAALATLLLYSAMLEDVLWWFLDRPSELVGVSTPGWAVAEARRVLTQSFGAEAVVLLAVLLGAVGFFSYLRKAPTAVLLYVAPGVVTLLGAVVARGTLYPRFFFALSAFAFLIFVRGLFALAEAAQRESRWPERLAAAAVAAMLLVSAAALARNASLPKQDYVGAIRHIEASAAPEDAVVGVGSIKYAARDYFEQDWYYLEEIAELESVRQTHRATWLVYTFPRYIAAASPGIFELIEERCGEQEVFPGTVGDGAVRVCRLPPLEREL